MQHVREWDRTNVDIWQINQVLGYCGITSSENQRIFFAQVSHESAMGTRRTEYAGGRAYEVGIRVNNDLGNIYIGDGAKFKGGGGIQLTGRANYQDLYTYLRDVWGITDQRILIGVGVDPFIDADSYDSVITRYDSNDNLPKGTYYTTDEEGNEVEIDYTFPHDIVATEYPWIASGRWWENNDMNSRIDNDNMTNREAGIRVNGGTNGASDRAEKYANFEGVFE